MWWFYLIATMYAPQTMSFPMMMGPFPTLEACRDAKSVVMTYNTQSRTFDPSPCYFVPRGSG